MKKQLYRDYLVDGTKPKKGPRKRYLSANAHIPQAYVRLKPFLPVRHKLEKLAGRYRWAGPDGLFGALNTLRRRFNGDRE